MTSAPETIELEAPRGYRGGGRAAPAQDTGGGSGAAGTSAAPQALLKIVGYRSGAAGARTSLRYIARDEAREAEAEHLRLETNTGEVLEGRAAIESLVADWALGFRAGKRDALHLVLSFPEGLGAADVRAIARAALRDIASERPFAFAVHEDTRHRHAHALIAMRDANGRSLRTNRQVLAQWRERLVERARERGVALSTSTRRERGLEPARTPLWEGQLLARGALPRRWVAVAVGMAERGETQAPTGYRQRFERHPGLAAQAFEAAAWQFLARARAEPESARWTAAAFAAEQAHRLDPERTRALAVLRSEHRNPDRAR